jgi:DNA modification methylase
LDFTHIAVNPSWAFADSTPAHTRYITHGYYTYPAKFIPQLAARLIRGFSKHGDIVVDPFMGSGTTVVEAMVQSRVGVGVDINPVAHLVARVKATPIDPALLDAVHAHLSFKTRSIAPENERIDYWFPPEQKEKLGSILGAVTKIKNENARDFFLVAFAQILKSCSIWLQRSVKPTRDLKKVPTDPFAAFAKQTRLMLKQNRAFWDLLDARVRENPDAFRRIECADARKLPVADGEATLVVTSPPYVTSYEYADLHQLAALWLQYCDSLPEFRKRFIGTAHSQRDEIQLHSPIADSICHAMGETKKSREVKNYFADMLECFSEMHRALKPGGKACIVIGNTELHGVKILNAEVFAEQMHTLGFCTDDIIKREIPSKMLPQTRDPETGKFASTANAKALAYPVEYILVMEKL